MHYGTCAGALRLQGSLVAGADQSLVGDGVGHHALAPHRLEVVQGTGWLASLLACADHGAVGDCSFSQALIRAWQVIVALALLARADQGAVGDCLLARADQGVVGAALLAGAVGSAVGGGVGWSGMLLVVVVVVLV